MLVRTHPGHETVYPIFPSIRGSGSGLRVSVGTARRAVLSVLHLLLLAISVLCRSIFRITRRSHPTRRVMASGWKSSNSALLHDSCMHCGRANHRCTNHLGSIVRHLFVDGMYSSLISIIESPSTGIT
jgi:hypothetical protein